MEDFDGARAAYEERLGLAEATGDPRLIADASYDIGFLFVVAGDAESCVATRRDPWACIEASGQRRRGRAEQALVLGAFLGRPVQTARKL